MADTLPDNKPHKRHWKNALKEFSFRNPPGSKDVQGNDSTDPQTRHEQGTPPNPTRRPSLSINRGPIRQNTLPPENDAYENSRREREALMRSLSSDKVNGAQAETPTSREHESNEPIITPPSQNSNIMGRKPLPSMLDAGFATVLAVGQTNEPLQSNGNGHFAQPNGASSVDINELHNKLNVAIVAQKSLEKERGEFEEKARSHWNLYETTWRQKKELEDRLAADAEFIASAQTLQQNHLTIVQDRDLRIQGLENELKSLRAARDLVVADVTRLTQENSRLEQDLQRSIATFNAVNKDLLQLKQELRSKVDDKWFIDQWEDLYFKIQNLSNQFFLGRLMRPTGSMVTRAKGNRSDKPETHKKLMVLTQEYAQYINSETHRPLIIQAFIWYILNNKVFDHVRRDSEGLLWAGTQRDTFSSLKSELRPLRRKEPPRDDPNEVKRVEIEARNYHRWRATTSIMLLSKQSVKKRFQHDDILDIEDDIMATISTYITRRESDRAKAEADLRLSLDDIITTAAALDAEMHQQRAWIYCEQWNCHSLQGNPVWGFRHDVDLMDQVLGPEQAKKSGRMQFLDPCVELIIQPALYKEGNQYGEEYSSKRVLCRAKVVVCENPTYPSSKRW